MPVYKKASTTDDLVTGLLTVLGGDGKPAYHEDTQRTLHLASGDSLTCSLVLDTRFKVAPSGWSA